MRNLQSLIAATAICWGVFSATAADANTITITPQDDASNHNLVTVSTTGNIVALLCGAAGGTTAECPPDALSGSFTAATGFAPFPDGSGSDPQAEADYLAALVGGTYTGGARQEGPGNQFDVAAGLFDIKQDGWIAFFFNLDSGPITLNISGAGLEGISHTTALSGPTPTQFCTTPGGCTFSVPAPIVGAGLPGLLAACGFLLAFARRRRQLNA
jgi:hypothetical protein